MSQEPPQLITIDDRDPQLKYTGSWTDAGTSANYQSTTSESQRSGSTVRFTFNGTFVAVYGTLGSTASDATYQLDSNPPINATFPAPSYPLNNVPFWSSDIVSPGGHTLTITVAQNDDIYQLDYIRYTGYTSSMSSSNLPLRSPPPTHAPSLFQSSSSSSHSGLSTAAVAGIIVACTMLVLIAVISGCVLHRIRRRRRLHKVVSALTDIEPEPEPEPVPSAIDIFNKFKIPFKARPPVSNGTETTAVFTSVVFLTPPVSVTSGPPSRIAWSPPTSATSGPRSYATPSPPTSTTSVSRSTSAPFIP